MWTFESGLRFALLGTALALSWAALATSDEVHTLQWDDLLPDGERPPPQVVDHSMAASFDDFPYSVDAKTVPELAGVRARLPGFVVPLDTVDGKVASLLLVPYFGACIHQPPPPPNQIVHVRFADPVVLDSMYTPVWVTGVMKLEQYSGLAESGYAMDAQGMEEYRWEATASDTESTADGDSGDTESAVDGAPPAPAAVERGGSSD